MKPIPATTDKVAAFKAAWHAALEAEQAIYEACCETRDFAPWHAAGHETDKRYHAFKMAFRRLHLRNPGPSDRV
jgi:hypothetical protein